MSHLTEIKNLPLSKPIEIEPIGFECQEQAVISISQIQVSGGYCDFPRFIKFLQSKSARLPCQLNLNPVCILFLFGQDPFSIGIKFYIHHFLYILSKAQHHLYTNMVYKWHDLRFIRLYPSIQIFKYLKPLYVEIQCMHSSLTVSN